MRLRSRLHWILWGTDSITWPLISAFILISSGIIFMLNPNAFTSSSTYSAMSNLLSVEFFWGLYMVILGLLQSGATLKPLNWQYQGYVNLFIFVFWVFMFTLICLSSISSAGLPLTFLLGLLSLGRFIRCQTDKEGLI